MGAGSAVGSLCTCGPSGGEGGSSEGGDGGGHKELMATPERELSRDKTYSIVTNAGRKVAWYPPLPRCLGAQTCLGASQARTRHGLLPGLASDRCHQRNPRVTTPDGNADRQAETKKIATEGGHKTQATDRPWHAPEGTWPGQARVLTPAAPGRRGAAADSDAAARTAEGLPEGRSAIKRCFHAHRCMALRYRTPRVVARLPRSATMASVTVSQFASTFQRWNLH